MITELSLKSFGAFRDKVFPLGAVTLFVGRNESGKTTLFDALFDALCHPKGASTHARTLRGRYGDDRSAKIAFSGEVFSVDPEEFLRLYAIRSGDLDIQLSKGKDWQDKVRAALFSGGIDPATLRDAFQLEASSKGNTRQAKAMRDKKGERENLAREREELDKKRQEILGGERLGRKREADLASLARQLEDKERQAAQLTTDIGQQDKIRRRRECAEIIRFLDEGEENSRALKALAALIAEAEGDADLVRLSELERSAGEARDGLSRSRAAESAASIESKRERVEKLQAEERELGPTANLARSFLDRIRTLGRDAPTVKRTEWNVPIVAVSAACLAVAVAVFGLLLTGSLPVWAFAAAVLFIGTGLALFATVGRRVRHVPDAAALEKAITVLRDEWRNRALVRREFSSTSVDGITDELLRLEADHAALTKRIVDETAELSRDERNLVELRQKTAAASQALMDREKELADWLTVRHAVSPEDYRHKRKEIDRLAESERKWRDELARKLETWKCQDAAALRLECRLKIEGLDAEITASELSEVERRRLENGRDLLRGEIEGLRAERDDLSAKVTEERGVVKGSLGDIPERIVRIERSLQKLDGEIHDLETTRKAAEIAALLFGQLVGDTRAGFLTLAGDIAGLFGELLPETRSIEFPELDEDLIKVGDAGGELRSLDNLSRGTRDSFLLAARLALALRSFPGQGVLILDEPLHSLDAERQKGALSLLASFHRQRGWQIILFSKDVGLADAVKELIPEAVVHTL